jgi:hypothetical protein
MKSGVLFVGRDRRVLPNWVIFKILPWAIFLSERKICRHMTSPSSVVWVCLSVELVPWNTKFRKTCSIFIELVMNFLPLAVTRKSYISFSFLLLVIPKWPVCNIQDSTDNIATDLLSWKKYCNWCWKNTQLLLGGNIFRVQTTTWQPWKIIFAPLFAGNKELNFGINFFWFGM